MLDDHELLLLRTDGHDQAASGCELRGEGLGHGRRGRGHHDGVERRHGFKSEGAIGVLHLDVGRAKLAQALARLSEQPGEALHRIHLAHEARKNRRLVAAAGPDFQRASERTACAREFEHAGNGEWRGNGLTEPDGQREILVGARLERFVDEDVPRHFCHGREHDLVADALLPEAFDHPQPRALRRHADTAQTGIEHHGGQAPSHPRRVSS